MSDEDRSYISELAENGVHVMVNLDPSQGGIFMAHDEAELNWAWLEEIDVVGDEEDDIVAYTDAGDAVVAALSATASSSSPTCGVASKTIEIEVTEEDLGLLRSLELSGFDIYLALDPHTGGLEATHQSGASLKWSFITDLQLEPESDDQSDLRTDDLTGMMTAFQASISL